MSLTITLLADRSEGERVTRYDPETGEKTLVNPATGEPESWPLAGVTITDPPQETTIDTDLVNRGRAEGWIVLEGESIVHRPGGPPEDLWRVTHTFVHAEALVFKCQDGDIRYTIVQNPDKYVDNDNPNDPVTSDIYAAGDTRVDHFYHVDLES